MSSAYRFTVVLVAAAACGDNGAETESATGSTSITTASMPSTPASEADAGTTTTNPDPTTSGPDVTSTTGQSTTTTSVTTTEDPTLPPTDTSDTSDTDDTTNGTCFQCTPDLHGVQTCSGTLVDTCEGVEGCDIDTVSCINACTAAENSKQSVGCNYYATFMEHWDGAQNRCFAAFVANTWNTPAKLKVTHAGQVLDVATFARRPQGNGPALTYEPYDSATGLPPGDVAILFLSGPKGQSQPGQAPCPVTSAVPSGVAVVGTGIGDSFRIESDVPVVAYQINPYGGGSAAVTGASLLLPTSAWDTNYVVINSLPEALGVPSANIVAHEDNTTITIDPVVDMMGGGGIPPGTAGEPVVFVLGAGEHAQLTQETELTGSVIQSDKPIGLMGGHTGMQAPVGKAFSDHAEQMIPPIRALGSEYVGVMYRPRIDEPAIWRVVGAVDGTELTWSSDVGGPTTLARGEKIEFVSADPFVVTSQDKDHPFFLFTYMSSSGWQPNLDGYGDPDFVISVPTDQYMPRYVFFTDPTYPETNLVLVRKKNEVGEFKDVELDCAGTLTGWQPIGDYEWTRTDLSTGDFMPVGDCANGRHEIMSEGRFALWIWGWGRPGTSIFTANVSYGYPAGTNLQLINDVIITPG